MKFWFTAKYEARCNECDTVTEAGEWILGPGSVFPWPALPSGWRVVDDYAVCPKHTITIKDKDEPASQSKS